MSKGVIPADSRYVPLVQQRSCCVPACISMVMVRHGLALLPQELLGYYLGLVVAPENRDLFWNPRHSRKPKSGWGTQIYKTTFQPNAVFKKFALPLKLKVHSARIFTTQSLSSFLAQAVKQDRDILVCFYQGGLDGAKSGSGHVCVVDRLYLKRGAVRLIDPSPRQPKWREVGLAALHAAMQFHVAKSGGVWEITHT